MVRIELFPIIPCKFSGVHLQLGKKTHECGDGYKYKEHAAVLGWFVVGWRVWTIDRRKCKLWD